jgi:hypothetical protein
MPNDGTPTPDRRPASVDALANAMAEISDEQAQGEREPSDRYWLRVGLGLGLRQPGRAQLLLERLEGAVSAAPASSALDRPRAVVDSATAADDFAAGAGASADEVPLRSMLLARSATLPADKEGGLDPEAVFGWASRATRDEVLWMGRVVTEMLAEGASPDLARGFAITWRSGAKLPEHEFDALFHAFTELELTVCGVLAGYDLRSASRTPQPRGLGSLLGALTLRGNPLAAEAGAILERGGEPAQRGLVAMWNAWAALRYRSAVPDQLFAQLVRPWTTVVGRLPEP